MYSRSACVSSAVFGTMTDSSHHGSRSISSIWNTITSAPTTSTPRPAPQPAPVAQPTPQAPVAEEWTVQVGSFSQADNARSLQARLKAEGFEAFVSRVATDAGTMHRVRGGPVPERADADRLLTRLRAAGHTGARVVRAQD